MLEDEADLPLARMLVGRILAVKRHDAAIRPFQACDDPQQRCLAGPGRTEQREQLAGLDVQVDVVDGDEVVEPLGDALEFDAHCLL